MQDKGPLLGYAIEVYWSTEKQWFQGISYKMTKDGRHIVQYDDGDERKDNLTGAAELGKKRKWRYVTPPSLSLLTPNRISTHKKTKKADRIP